MNRDEAIALARSIAASCDTELGEMLHSRGAAADPNAQYWSILCQIKDGPQGWVWVFDLNDCGKQQVMIAHNPRLGKSLRERSTNQSRCPRGRSKFLDFRRLLHNVFTWAQ